MLMNISARAYVSDGAELLDVCYQIRYLLSCVLVSMGQYVCLFECLCVCLSV